jgi:hypothetical protein
MAVTHLHLLEREVGIGDDREREGPLLARLEGRGHHVHGAVRRVNVHLEEGL